MQAAKVLSTLIKKNRAGAEVMTVTAELRKGQNVTAQWIDSAGESATPVVGQWAVVTPQNQSFGGHLAFGFVDVINSLFSDRGVKIIYGRDAEGVAKTKISLTDSEVIIENPSSAQISLTGGDIILNEGMGTAVEADRLQAALDTFSGVVLQEFGKVAAGTEPNPVAPYVPSPSLPVDIETAKSETVKLP